MAFGPTPSVGAVTWLLKKKKKVWRGWGREEKKKSNSFECQSSEYSARLLFALALDLVRICKLIYARFDRCGYRERERVPVRLRWEETGLVRTSFALLSTQVVDIHSTGGRHQPNYLPPHPMLLSRNELLKSLSLLWRFLWLPEPESVNECVLTYRRDVYDMRGREACSCCFHQLQFVALGRPLGLLQKIITSFFFLSLFF